MKPTDQTNATLTAAKRPRIASVVMIIGASIVLLVPTADNYHDTRASRIALEEEKVSQSDRGELQRLRHRLSQMQAAHEQWQHRGVAPQRSLEFQNELIAIARSLKCRVRHASLGPIHRKPWRAEDNPFADSNRPNPPNTASHTAGGQVLASQSMKLTLEGSYDNCQQFITTLQAKRRLIGVKSLEFHPPKTNDELIQLNIELLLFTLEAPAPKQRKRVGA